MKTFLLSCLLLISFAAGTVKSQWIQQYPVTPSNHLADAHFINDKTGWICGNQGTILHTTNGGFEWIKQESGVTKSLYRIFAADSQTIYCVGFFDCILKTTNAGNNWNILRNSTKQSPTYEGIFFLNKDTGWISKNLYILRTTNGGLTFDSSMVKPSFIFDIYFRNFNEGLFCGEASYMYRTTNAGLNWTQIDVVKQGDLPNFRNLSFINYNTGFIQGSQNNKVFKTTNFGLSWDSTATVQGMDDSYSIRFTDINTGWCAGTFGKMFKTTNGGYNWNQVNLEKFNTTYIRDLFFYDNFIGWAVGASTKILYTDNGGKTGINYQQVIIDPVFQMFTNYPNPFNSQTIISYQLNKNGFISLKVFDNTGKLIEILKSGYQQAGFYKINWNSRLLSSGIYFCQIISGKQTEMKKLILIK